MRLGPDGQWVVASSQGDLFTGSTHLVMVVRPPRIKYRSEIVMEYLKGQGGPVTFVADCARAVPAVLGLRGNPNRWVRHHFRLMCDQIGLTFCARACAVPHACSPTATP